MEVKCPHCEVELKAPDEHFGKQVKCPKCKQPFIVHENVRMAKSFNATPTRKGPNKSNNHKDFNNLSVSASKLPQKKSATQAKQTTTVPIGIIPEKLRIYLDSNEKKLYASNPSFSSLVLSMIVPVFGFIAFGISFINTPPLILFALTLVAVFFGLATFLSWKHRYYIITTTRTLSSQGIFNVGVSIIPNKSIQMICINTGIIDRWLGLNTLEVSSAAQGGMNVFQSFAGKATGAIQFKSIKDVHKVVKLYDFLLK